MMDIVIVRNAIGTPRWAGNISQLAWCSGSESTMKRYSFSYDGFGRLLSAAYNGGAMGGNYSTSYAYDANSNLTSIARAAVTGLSSGLVLPRTGTAYLLDGNQVQARLQGGGLRSRGGLRPSLELRQVYYDACGRMVCDSDRGINKIEYNALYLPSTIEYATDGNSLTGYSYGVQYAADGRKLRTGRLAQATKRLQNATVTDYPEEEELVSVELESLIPSGERIPVSRFESPTDYVGNLVYKDGVLEKILIDGGFITAADGRYHFFVTDHLGNVRVVVNDAGVIEQVNQFYPYGESIELDPASANPGVETITENPYKWGGKEWDEEQGAYDFGARMYSASDARWTTMDPLCEKYYSISPYAYCAGNPLNLVDPDGESPIVGALVGAALDAGLQVITNRIQGQSLGESIKIIDGKSVLISAGAGALGVGLVTKVKQAKNLVSLGKAAVVAAETLTEAAVSGAESAAKQVVCESSFSLEQIAIDSGIGALSSDAGQAAKGLKQLGNSSEKQVLKRQASRTKRLANGSTR